LLRAAPADAWVVDRRYARLSAALAVCAMLFSELPPGLNFHYDAGRIDNSSGGVLGLVQWPLLFLAGLGLLLLRFRLALNVARWLNPLLPLVLGWFLLSTLWSVA